MLRALRKFTSMAQAGRRQYEITVFDKYYYIVKSGKISLCGQTVRDGGC